MAKLDKETEKLSNQFDEFDKSVKNLTMDEMNKSPVLETEPQTKISQKDLEKSPDIYLKPEKTIGCKEKFNEKFREEYNFKKEYVQFIAEHKEIIGETIECWTKAFPGVSAEFWKVPVNKPVWGPRYLAEQLHSRGYHRLVMDESTIVGSDSNAKYYGRMVAKNFIHRLDAQPVSNKKSIFMGA